MKRILTYGTFDLFHFGHLEILRRAKKLGDYLIVGVSTDEFNSIKGKKCIYSTNHRMEIVKSIKYVDAVIPESSWKQKKEDIILNKIDILVMGNDWKNKFDDFDDFCKVIYLSRTKGISSSFLKKIIKNND